MPARPVPHTLLNQWAELGLHPWLDVAIDSGTGRLRQPLYQWGPIFDVEYLAPLGSPDDTTNVQAAIEAAAAQGGGCVRISTVGTINISQIALKARVVLLLPSRITTMKQIAGFNGPMVVQNSASFWSEVHGGLWDGNKANQTTPNDVFNYDHTGSPGDKYHVIENVIIRNAKGNAITLGAGCQVTNIRDSYIVSNDGYGISVGASDQVLHNLSVGHSGKDGVRLAVGSSGSNLTDVVSFWSGDVDGIGHGFRLESVNNAVLTGCLAEDSAGAGYGITGFGNAHVLSGCMAESNRGPVLKADHMNDGMVDIVVGPGVRATSTYAIDFSGGSNLRNMVRIGGYQTGFTTAVNGSILGNQVQYPGSPIRSLGPGSPEGVVTAPIGSTHQRTDGGAGTSFYVKESGVGNTGWVAK